MNILLKRLLLISFIFPVHFVHGQNIVPNGNLEDVNICDEYHCPCSPSGWFIVKNAVPTGYYHNYPDPAASGTQYFEIAAVNYGTTRQYWQTKLLCKLVPGEKYDVSVKVAAQETGPNVNDIGFYFTNSFIFSTKDTLLQPPAYLNFMDAKISRLKHNWFQLKKEFVASADNGYLIIGNFSPDDNASILKKRNFGNRPIGIMIDDIVVKPRHASNCISYEANKDSLYAITRRHGSDSLKIKKKAEDAIAAKRNRSDTMQVKIDTLRLSNVLFEFDRFQLINPDTLETFRFILSNPTIKKLKVTGYTDDAGSEAYNKELSLKRAQEIARLLGQKFEFFPGAIEVEGKGISTEFADKSLNRRVDIYVYY